MFGYRLRAFPPVAWRKDSFIRKGAEVKLLAGHRWQAGVLPGYTSNPPVPFLPLLSIYGPPSPQPRPKVSPECRTHATSCPGPWVCRQVLLSLPVPSCRPAPSAVQSDASPRLSQELWAQPHNHCWVLSRCVPHNPAETLSLSPGP